MKKILAVILSLVMLLGCVVISTSAAAAGTYVNTDKTNHVAKDLGTADSYLGYHVNVNAAFDGASFHFYTWSSRKGQFEFSVYKWDETFEKTLEGTPIASNTVTADGSADIKYTSPLKFNAVPAGEYLFYMYVLSGSPDVGALAADTLQNRGEEVVGDIYYNSNIADQSFMPMLQITTTEACDGDLFSGTSESTDPEKPEEVVADIPAYGEVELNVGKYATLEEDGYSPMYFETINGVDRVTNFRPGDYIVYNVNVLEAGSYDLTLNYACKWQDFDFRIYVDGVEADIKLSHVQADFIDWNTPVWTNTAQIELPEGKHTIKVYTGNLTYFWGIKLGSYVDIPAYGEVELNVGKYATLEEDGYSPMYFETVNGVDRVTNFRPGDYIVYNVNVLEAGNYDLALNYACKWDDFDFKIYVDGVKTDIKLSHVKANFIDWNTPVWTNTAQIELPEGKHTIKVYTGNVTYFWGIKLIPEVTETYVYTNALDGSVYTFNAPLSDNINEIDADVLAKFNLYANGEYNKVTGFELVSSIDGVHTYRSVHNTEATVNVTVGTATKYNGYYILNAEETKDGKNFEGWYEGDKLISYKTTYKFFPDKATTEITAKYVAGEVVKENKVQVEANRTQDKLTVKVTPMQGTGYTIKEYGYFIATSADAMDAQAVKDADRGASTTAPHVYMVRVYDIDQTTTVNQNIYLVGWIKLYDENGAYVNTLYTDLVTVTPVA